MPGDPTLIRRILLSSTFRRLTLIYLLLFGSSVLILFGFIYWSTIPYMSRQVDATIEAEIDGLAERYRRSGLVGLTRLIEERIARNPGSSSVYLLTGPDFAPLAGNLDRWPAVSEDAAGWLEFRLGERGEKNRLLHRARARTFRLPGGFHLLAGRDVRDLDAMKETIVRTLVWGLIITLALGVAGGLLMSGSLLRRIETINRISREIMSGNLSRRIPTRGTEDDLDLLAVNLNAMLDRIEQLMQEVRRVSDNIAHDLRTPLARLRNQLELLTTQLGAGEPREIAERALVEADRLLATFGALLRIARVESTDRREAFEVLHLEQLLQDLVELYEPLAEEKGLRLASGLETVAPVRGDRDLLFQALANLLDNAIKYTPAGGQIRVTLGERPGGGARVVIADTGPGIPAEAREQVFQRFFRLEESRTTPGNGLGLALVEAVAKLHGIRLSLEDNGPGLRVVCDFTGPRTADRGNGS